MTARAVRLWSILFLLVLACLVWAAEKQEEEEDEGEDGSDFVDNLISDLGPLLTLFGERFAQQFLAESFSWLDHIVFSMAPLGIITALIGAIRVGGPTWVKALVGRARENVAEAEMELMSSTSEEVCELYNGRAIVRTMGRPTVKQIIYLESLKNKKTFGLYTLESPESPFKGKKLPQPYLSRFFSSSSSDLEQATDKPIYANDVGESNEQAPNISLNLHGLGRPGELAFYALIGVVLQTGVLILAGVINYHPFMTTKFGDPDSPSGFPLQAIGTVLLVIGMAICSVVIEESTFETTWNIDQKRVNEAQKDLPANPQAEESSEGIHLFWLQKKHFAADHSFDAYLLAPKQPNAEVLTSRRYESGQPTTDGKKSSTRSNTYLSNLTIIGNACGLVGFILQFQGFRLSHWLGSLFQLIAVGIMTVLRAVIRRGLTATPQVLELPEEYELDYTALRIADDPDFIKNLSKEGPNDGGDDNNSGNKKDLYWHISTSGNGVLQYAERCSLESSKERHGPNNLAQKALEIRKRLGELTKWTSAYAEDAIIIAKSIEVVLEKLVDIDGDEFYWQLKVDHNIACDADASKQSPAVVQFKVKRVNLDGGHKGKWEVDSTEIEAALSLWNYGIWKSNQTQKISPQLKGSQDWLREVKNDLFGTCYRAVCEETEASKQDLKWWVSELPSQIEDQPHRPSNNVFWWGFDGCKEDSQQGTNAPSEKRTSNDDPASTSRMGVKRFAISSPWKQSLANHLFSGFMWGVAEYIQAGRFAGTRVFPGSFDLDLPDTWDTIELENNKLSEVLRDIENIGLGSPDQISLSIIPPLSSRNKLPDEAVVNFVHQRVLDYETKHRWNKASRAYLKLLEMSVERGASDKFAFRAVAVTVEFLFRMISEPVADDSDKEGDWESIPKLRSILTAKLSHGNLMNHVAKLNSLYANQCKQTLLENLFSDCDIPTGDFEEVYNYEGFTDVLGWNKLQRKHIYTLVNCDSTEYRTWKEIVDNLNVSGIEDWRLDMNHVDILGITSLRHLIEEHYFVAEQVWWDLIQKGHPKLELKGRDGMTVLHVAARMGRSNVVEVLTRLVGRVDIPDYAGRTAMHLAAWVGSADVAMTLIAKYTDLTKRDIDGRTPLHFAAWKGHRFISYSILKGNKAVLDISDNDGRTALHFAAQSGDEATVEHMLRLNGDILGMKDRYGKTAMHSATESGHHGIVNLMMQANTSPDTLESNSDERSQRLSVKNTDPGIGGVMLEDKQKSMDSKDGDGMTPLHIAAMSGDHLSVKLMLQQPNLELSPKDNLGRTPLSLACKESQEEVVKVMAEYEKSRSDATHASDDGPLDKGRIDFNSIDNRGNTPLSHAVWHGNLAVLKAMLDTKLVDVNFRTFSKPPALEFCSTHGNAKVVEVLLDAEGIDVNLETEYGDTPLALALMYGHEQVAALLLAANNIDVNQRNSIDATPLILAINAANWEAAKHLISKGVDVNVTDYNGSTPLLEAIQHGNTEVSKRLIEAGSALDVETPEEDTPLSLAASKGMPEVVKLILDQGIDADFVVDGMTPLCSAAVSGQVECVKCLLDAGAEASRLDDNGQPSFIYAVHGGSVDVVKLFLEHGADVNQTTAEGQSSLFYAVKKQDAEMLEFLLNSGADPNIPDDEDGWTPLFCAVMLRDIESAELLVRGGADVTFRANNGKTAIEFSEAEDLLSEERWSSLFAPLIKSQDE